MLWRKALIATVIITIMTITLNSIVGLIVRSALDPNNIWLQQMNWTVGSFIVMVDWIGLMIKTLLIFVTILWVLRIPMPVSREKMKRTSDEGLFSPETSDRLVEAAHPNAVFDRDDQVENPRSSSMG